MSPIQHVEKTHWESGESFIDGLESGETEDRWSKEARCEKADRGHVSATNTVEHEGGRARSCRGNEPREQERKSKCRMKRSEGEGADRRGGGKEEKDDRGKQTVLRQFWHCYQHERLSANPEQRHRLCRRRTRRERDREAKKRSKEVPL